MQVARATLALATGELRSLRLAREIGGREVPHGPSRRIALPERHLTTVRRALERVASAPGGTARRALGPDQLGIRIAVKTGSADLTGRSDDGDVRVRKHTWVSGWFPAEEPVACFVVFVHDTSVTSSHGAVWVARQFLLQPELFDWMVRQGIDVSEMPLTAR